MTKEVQRALDLILELVREDEIPTDVLTRTAISLLVGIAAEQSGVIPDERGRFSPEDDARMRDSYMLLETAFRMARLHMNKENLP